MPKIKVLEFWGSYIKSLVINQFSITINLHLTGTTHSLRAKFKKDDKKLTNPALIICASNSCPPGDEANTYSTMLSPTPSADLGDSTLCDSEGLLKFAPLVGRCTMIGWDTACSDCAIWGTDGPQAVSLHCSPKKMPDVIPPWFSSPESWTSQSFFAVEAICKGQGSLEWYLIYSINKRRHSRLESLYSSVKQGMTCFSLNRGRFCHGASETASANVYFVVRAVAKKVSHVYNLHLFLITSRDAREFKRVSFLWVNLKTHHSLQVNVPQSRANVPYDKRSNS